MASCGTHHQEVESQQVAVPRAPPHGPHLGVLLLRNIAEGALGQGGVSSMRRGGVAMAVVAYEHLAVPILYVMFSVLNALMEFSEA
jgi:hypothetical protein